MVPQSLKVFVAGPMQAATVYDTVQNVKFASAVGLKLWEMGHFPYIPQLNHYTLEQARDMGLSLEVHDYLAWDEKFLTVCDAIFLIADSPGAQRALEVALDMHIPVWRSFDEVPDARVDQLRQVTQMMGSTRY